MKTGKEGDYMAVWASLIQQQKVKSEAWCYQRLRSSEYSMSPHLQRIWGNVVHASHSGRWLEGRLIERLGILPSSRNG